MARPLRIEFSSACYHITSRGVAKQEIFFEEEDPFLRFPAEMHERWRVVVHGYCHMSNH